MHTALQNIQELNSSNLLEVIDFSSILLYFLLDVHADVQRGFQIPSLSRYLTVSLFTTMLLNCYPFV
jgi:hypothetical protein